MTALIILNGEMEDIIKIFKSLKESRLLIKCVSQSIKNEVKEQKGGFFGMFLGTLGATLLVRMLAGKVMIRAGEGITRGGDQVIQESGGVIRAGHDF